MFTVKTEIVNVQNFSLKKNEVDIRSLLMCSLHITFDLLPTLRNFLLLLSASTSADLYFIFSVDF